MRLLLFICLGLFLGVVGSASIPVYSGTDSERLLDDLKIRLSTVQSLRSIGILLGHSDATSAAWEDAWAALAKLQEEDIRNVEAQILELAMTYEIPKVFSAFDILCSYQPSALNRLISLPEEMKWPTQGRMPMDFRTLVDHWASLDMSNAKFTLSVYALKRRLIFKDLPTLDDLQLPLGMSEKRILILFGFAAFLASKEDSLLPKLESALRRMQTYLPENQDEFFTAARTNILNAYYQALTNRMERKAEAKQVLKHILELYLKGILTDDDVHSILKARYRAVETETDISFAREFFIRIAERANSQGLISTTVLQLRELAKHPHSSMEKLRIRQLLDRLDGLGLRPEYRLDSATSIDLFVLKRETSRLPQLIFECWQGLQNTARRLAKKNGNTRNQK